MGILLNKSFTSLRIRFPKKDKESQPIKIRINIDITISKPGIEKGK